MISILMLFMILLILCILFGFSGSIVYHNESNLNQLTESNSKPIQEAFTFNQYDMYLIRDLYGDNAMNNYVDWVYNNDGVNLLNTIYSRQLICDGSMYFDYGFNLTSTNINTITYRYLTCYRIVIESGQVQNYNNNSCRPIYLRFYDTTDPNTYIEFLNWYCYNNSLGATRIWFTGAVSYNSGGVANLLDSSQMLICEYQNDNIKGWCRSFLPYADVILNSSDNGFSNGYTLGYNTGIADGYNNGYNQGYADADGNFNMNPDMLTIFTGILNIGLLPVNVFLSIFNFEVFGINIAGFVSSLITIAIVIIIVRFIFGGKKND